MFGMKMKSTSHIPLLVAVLSVFGCMQPGSTISRVYVNRTPPDAALVKVHLDEECVTVERPYEFSGRTLHWPLIQLNPIMRSSSYIGDTQYLTTINIKKYSHAEWEKQLEWGNHITSGITNSEWKTFQEWFYSEPGTTSMKERDGFRYYLRVIKDPRIGVVEIRGEHNCFQREFLDQDDKVVRRIMDSVAFDPETQTRTEPTPAGDVLKAAPKE